MKVTYGWLSDQKVPRHDGKTGMLEIVITTLWRFRYNLMAVRIC